MAVQMLNRTTPPRPPLRVLIAAPRGFCAGVDRAIQIVELALERFGAPVYVRHEIVHNRFVVDRLKELGAVFVDELDEVPDDRPVVFSAHGVPKAVPANALQRGLTYVDATCPLVSKVHRQAQRLIEEGRHILFIGHAGHPEVIGTFGQVPPGAMTLVETVADVAALDLADNADLAFLTQTTLSVDDTALVVEALKARFPEIRAPRSEDICYATSNRQAAVKAIAPECDRMLVIGAPNSSNSLRLAEVAERLGVAARLIERRRHRLAMARPARNARRHSGRIGARSAGARSDGSAVRAIRRERGACRPHARANDLQAPARTRRVT